MTSALLNNRYNILRGLGRGGFGETFLAEDTQMPSRRRCVIKQLKPSTDKPEMVQLIRDRFSREAAILESVGDHPQIPTLYAYFVEDDRFYLIQEWIEGRTLSEIVRDRGSLPEENVTLLLQQLLPILSYIHDQGIIHRDIKPDNILVRQRDGQPVLIDFGAVRETMGTTYNSQGQTTSSIVIGTPGFMPSEQAVGRPVFSSDIYALGLTAIYLLTSRYPQEILTDPRTGELQWHALAPTCHPRLRDVLDRATMSHPRDRFATAIEMLTALNPTAPRVAPLNFPNPNPPLANPAAHSPLTPPTSPSPNPYAPRPYPPVNAPVNAPVHSPVNAPGRPAYPPINSPINPPINSPINSPHPSPIPARQNPPVPPAAATEATIAAAPVYHPTVPVSPAQPPARPRPHTPNAAPANPASQAPRPQVPAANPGVNPGATVAHSPQPASHPAPQAPQPSPQNTQSRTLANVPVWNMVKFGIMIGMVGGLSIALLNAISQMNFGINVNFNFPSLQLPNLANNAPVTSAENNTGGGSENDGGFLPNLPLPELSLPKRSQFYFLADSAFSSTEGAKIRVDELKANGYKRAGLFNASDYPNLFGDNYVQVYVNTFTNKDACVNELKRYGKQKLDAYCARASVDANVSHEMIDTSQVMLEASPGNSEMDANNSEPSWLDRVQNWLNW